MKGVREAMRPMPVYREKAQVKVVDHAFETLATDQYTAGEQALYVQGLVWEHKS